MAPGRRSFPRMVDIVVRESASVDPQNGVFQQAPKGFIKNGYGNIPVLSRPPRSARIHPALGDILETHELFIVLGRLPLSSGEIIFRADRRQGNGLLSGIQKKSIA